MRHENPALPSALAAIACLVTGAVAAQPVTREVAVDALHVERKGEPALPAGAPTGIVSVRHVVSYEDLDLSTITARITLKQRIADAAVLGCKELEALVPRSNPVLDRQWCVKSATHKAWVLVEPAIEAAQRDAKP